MNDQVGKVINSIHNLQLNVNDFHMTNDFTNRLYSQMTRQNLIGEGGVGKVFLVENGKYVIKQANPCVRDNKILQEYCQDIINLVEDEDEIIMIPSGENKYRYIIPNLLCEAAIGFFFTDLVDQLISPHYSKTLGSFILYDGVNVEIYFIMEAHKPVILTRRFDKQIKQFIDPNMRLQTPIHYLYLLFQVSHSLLQAQQYYKFTHYDLHIGNILWDEYPKNINYISYPIPNRADNLRNIIIPKNRCNFMLKITDYGLSRMESRNVLITPKIDNFPDATFGEFNPSYDLISFLGTTIMASGGYNPFSFVFSDLELFESMLRFILWFFKDTDIIIPRNPNLRQLQNKRNEIGRKYWTQFRSKEEDNFGFRPKPIELNLVAYYNTRSMVEVVNRLAEILYQNKSVLLYRAGEDVLNIRRLSENYTTYAPIRSLPDSNNPIPIPGKGEIATQMKEFIFDSNIITINRYKILINALPEDYNLTITNKQRDECPLQEHYITAVKIDKTGSKFKGYSFKSLCCKLDPASYLRENRIYAIAINGGYFNIRGDYLPIGPYRDNMINTNQYEIPEKYKDVYGFVTINELGDLQITKSIPSNYSYLFASGPIMIDDGEIVFNPYEERFACDVKTNIKPGIRVLEETEDDITVSGYYKYGYNSKDKPCKYEVIEDVKTFPRCDRINPGELSHSDNPNPRSALAVMNNGDYILITVEGREQRGVGMDLKILAKSIKSTFPNVKTLINLDGGRSSNLAWRSPLDPNTVYITNPAHLYQYPVGNILLFSRS